MRGYYGNHRRRVMLGAEPPNQGAAVPVIIMGGAVALLVAILRDEQRLGKG